MHIERIDTLDLAARGAISATMDAYNAPKTGRPEPAERMAVLVRDAAGQTLGGAWCLAYWDWLHVDLLHLPERLRGRGMGARVMAAVEREAARRGRNGIWLDTATYQAPGFYHRLGYTELGRIADYSHGHDRIFLLKRTLADGPDDPGLAVVQNPAAADHAIILDGLLAYNESQDGPSGATRLGLLVRDTASGPILGGLWGSMSRGWLFVELLALPEQARRAGLGTELMRLAEQATLDRGGKGVWLDTFSFQARPFYEKRGYRLFGTIPDYPIPHTRYLLAKRLAD